MVECMPRAMFQCPAHPQNLQRGVGESDRAVSEVKTNEVGLALPDIKLYYKFVIGIEMVCHYTKENRREGPKMWSYKGMKSV